MLGTLIDVIEDRGQMKNIFITSSAVVTIGQLYRLPPDKVTVTDLAIADTIGCLSQIEFSANKLFRQDDMLTILKVRDSYQ